MQVRDATKIWSLPNTFFALICCFCYFHVHDDACNKQVTKYCLHFSFLSFTVVRARGCSFCFHNKTTPTMNATRVFLLLAVVAVAQVYAAASWSECINVTNHVGDMSALQVVQEFVKTDIKVEQTLLTSVNKAEGDRDNAYALKRANERLLALLAKERALIYEIIAMVNSKLKQSETRSKILYILNLLLLRITEEEAPLKKMIKQNQTTIDQKLQILVTIKTTYEKEKKKRQKRIRNSCIAANFIESCTAPCMTDLVKAQLEIERLTKACKDASYVPAMQNEIKKLRAEKAELESKLEQAQSILDKKSELYKHAFDAADKLQAENKYLQDNIARLEVSLKKK